MLFFRKGLGLLLALATAGACAQLTTDNPDWKEAEVPPPPAFDQSKLVPVEVALTSALTFGIDPATVTITNDGVVRYVVVASSRTGALNAMYEGIRCSAGDVKVYARYNRDSGWNKVTEPSWQSLYGGPGVRHSLSIARAGVCRNHAPNLSVNQILRDLRSTPDRKFE